MINRAQFYEKFKRAFGKLSQKQVEGFEAIFDECQLNGCGDLRWLAYMFATAWHETAFKMHPIEEYGKGIGRAYGKKLKHSGIPYQLPNKIYYGRGFVQLTWFENYHLMGRLLRVDLLNYPELALNPKVAARIMFEGMTRGASSFGDFTGKCLEQYFNDINNDPIGARRIVNGTDKAQDIAKYHYKFLDCLNA